MTDRPILFSSEMVRAILDGRKTQTRRVITPQPLVDFNLRFPINWKSSMFKTTEDFAARCSYGHLGDRLWVRENGCERPDRSPKMMRDGANTWPRYMYDADDCDHAQLREWGWRRRPSIHMPRWASRITLEIVSIRVERVKTITDDGAIEEGVDRTNTSIPGYATTRYVKLWDSINAKRGFPWSSNPWVWAIEFKRVEVSK